MKSKRSKKLSSSPLKTQPIDQRFYSDSELIIYDVDDCYYESIKNINDINFDDKSKKYWLNIYGHNHSYAIQQIAKQNKIDEFLTQITTNSDHRNKTLELSNIDVITAKSIFLDKNKESDFGSEQMIFAVGDNFIISIQEVVGDNFEHIRNRLKNNLGIVRKKNIHYLLYLMIEAIIDFYDTACNYLKESNNSLKNIDTINPNPEFAKKVETYKNHLLFIKKAAISLKEALLKYNTIQKIEFNTKYNNELIQQLEYIKDDIDHNIQQLESTINMIFNIQNHRLNEVMKTLTIISVIFIPLTFIAGVYGMNFQNMPELKSHYGYYIILCIMLLIAISAFIYFKKKKWF